MPSHARPLPWWRRWSVLAPALVAGVTGAAVVVGVYGLSPGNASEPPHHSARAAAHSSAPASRRATPPVRLTVRAGVVTGTTPGSELGGSQVDVATVPTLSVRQAQHLLAAGHWQSYPAAAGGRVATPIVWRDGGWRLVEAASVQVPYAGGTARSLVKLIERDSGMSVWFLDARPPAGVTAAWHGPMTALEGKLAQELGADGTPVVYLGDDSVADAGPIGGAGIDFAAPSAGAGLTQAVGTVS